MEKILLTAAIFLVPTLLLVAGFKLSGRRVEWAPLLWSGFAFAVYMTLLRSRGVIPEPAFMAELSLNWYGKGLAILGTLTMLYYLHGVAWTDAGLALSLPAIVMTGTIGFVEGWLRERSGSLVAPILFHNGFNLAQSFV